MTKEKVNQNINRSGWCNLILIVFFVMFQVPAFSEPKSFVKKIQSGCPQWMREQISRDLKPFCEQRISKSELYQIYLDTHEDAYVVKFEIRKNRVHTEIKLDSDGLRYRTQHFNRALQDLCNNVGMADTTFYVTLHDGFCQFEINDPLSHFPLFVMSRGVVPGSDVHSILIPDYDGCNKGYQVLEKNDVTRYVVPWSKKKDLLIWRGSTVQGPHSIEIFAEGCSDLPPLGYSQSMNEGNAHLFSRYLLCKLSEQYPELINGKYTWSADLEKTFPEISKYIGNWLSFKEQFNYKYHILLNGNAAPYSNSGWKFFTNSVIFIPEEPFMTQWYYNALQPYEHYIPVRNDLEDLVEKVIWARNHDKQCERIAKNAREFAIHNLTRDDYLVYFFYLLKEYSKLLDE